MTIGAGTNAEAGWNMAAPAARDIDGVLHYARYPIPRFFTVEDPEIARENLVGICDAGRIRITVDCLDVGRLVRNISGFDSAGNPKPVPEPAGPIPLGAHRTRWDFDASSFADCGPRSRVRIEVHVTAPRVRFLPGFDPIMLGSVDALQKITDLEVDPLIPNLARFWLQQRAGRPQRWLKFNLLLLVEDRDDPTYAVPLVIDPAVPHRG